MDTYFQNTLEQKDIKHENIIPLLNFPDMQNAGTLNHNFFTQPIYSRTKIVQSMNRPDGGKEWKIWATFLEDQPF